MVAERVVLLGIEHFQQRRLRVTAEVAADLVDLVDHHDGVASSRVAQRAYDRARHRADVGTPMAADLGFVADAADREAHELTAHRTRDRLPERRLADAGRTDEAQDRAAQALLQFADGEVLDDPVLDLIEVVVVLVEDRPRLLDVDRVARLLAPRQLHEPVEVGADDAVLGRRLRHFRQPVELAVRGLADLLGHLRLVDLLAQFVGLGLLRIGLAQLFLNRAQLLAQIELALILLHLALDVGLDLVTRARRPPAPW